MHNRSTHIADLNLLLTIFIVILHSLYNPNKTIYHSGTYLSLYNILVTLFDSAVPTFFVISSFLFFRNLSKSQIIAKIKKRFKSSYHTLFDFFNILCLPVYITRNENRS